jgi:hypothetical protein
VVVGVSECHNERQWIMFVGTSVGIGFTLH